MSTSSDFTKILLYDIKQKCNEIINLFKYLFEILGVGFNFFIIRIFIPAGMCV